MKNVAVITEYNPFHKGHGIQINKIKELFGEDVRIICIMSGNTVQRGEVALYDKYLRAKAAVMHGASAVFELPFPYSSSCAEIFACAGVYIAKALGGMDALVFGSETGDIKVLERVSDRISSKEFERALEEISKTNKALPYPRRRQAAYELLYGEELLNGANDILAVEYIKAIKNIAPEITPVTYKRQEGFSAGATRQEIRHSGTSSGLTEVGREIFEGAPHTDSVRLGQLLLQDLRRAEMSRVQGVFDMPRDLGMKMKQESLACADYEEFIQAMKGAGYTDARIRRELLYLWCGVEDIGKTPEYTTVLALDERGREYISSIRKTKTVPVITKPADYKDMTKDVVAAFELAKRADHLFAYALEKALSPAEMLKTGPWIKEKMR